MKTLVVPILLSILLSALSIPALGADQTQEIRRHASGAQCWSTLDRRRNDRLGEELSDALLIQGSYRVWYLAPLMKPDGYSITFAADGSIESDALCTATRWRIEDNAVLLFDADGRQRYAFRHSEGCGTLVHEYEYGSTAQVLEIGAVIEDGSRDVASASGQPTGCRRLD